MSAGKDHALSTDCSSRSLGLQSLRKHTSAFLDTQGPLTAGGVSRLTVTGVVSLSPWTAYTRVWPRQENKDVFGGTDEHPSSSRDVFSSSLLEAFSLQDVKQYLRY